MLAMLVAVLMVATPARAEWTLNLGYQNPAVSTFGVNFLHFWTNWAFEIGVGWVDINAREKTSKNDDDTTTTSKKASFAAAGDVDFKYLFSSGGVRPFLQGGMGIGIGAASDEGLGAGMGGGFFGGGLFFGSPSFYGYASYNLSGSKEGFLQGGIGFDI